MVCINMHIISEKKIPYFLNIITSIVSYCGVTSIVWHHVESGSCIVGEFAGILGDIGKMIEERFRIHIWLMFWLIFLTSFFVFRFSSMVLWYNAQNSLIITTVCDFWGKDEFPHTRSTLSKTEEPVCSPKREKKKTYKNHECPFISNIPNRFAGFTDKIPWRKSNWWKKVKRCRKCNS